MKFHLGVNRFRIDDDGNVMMAQYSQDILSVELPDDGSEFIRNIWFTPEDDPEVLINLPVHTALTITRFS